MNRLLVAVVAVSMAAACSPSSAAPPGFVSSLSPSPAPVASSSGPAPSLTFAFGGDVHFFGRTAPLLTSPSTAFGSMAATLRAADLTMVNLETAITERGTEQPKTFHFRAPATAFDALRAAGVDLVTMANNHVLDYGQVGLADTLAGARGKQFPIVGIGLNAAEAYRPLVVDVRGVRVAFLAFSQVHDLADSWAARDDRPGVAMAFDTARVKAAVGAARRASDLVIVFNHWGQEGNSCPTPEQKAFAGTLAAAGADIVIGAHAHVLQGDGWLGSTYVEYGLGNFLWYSVSRATATGVLRLTVRGRTVVRSEFLPAVVSPTGQPKLLAGADAAAASQRYAALRRCTGLSGSP
jgi:poly-gamma-glutamate synthesis protein (capsule biosynthesis protein)